MESEWVYDDFHSMPADIFAYWEYDMLGGPEGIDEYFAHYEDYIPDEDGEQAYERHMDEYASREQEIEDRCRGF
jgi:hypothetical protein